MVDSIDNAFMSLASLDALESTAAPHVNVADRLALVARQMPRATAVVQPGGRRRVGSGAYSTCSFEELDADATAIARALGALGVRRGMRLVLLVPPGIEFVKLVFGLLRSGATTVLVDPGMGRKHLVNCIAAAEPDGFVAVSRAQAVRALLRRRFPRAAYNVTIGRRWFWGGRTYGQLLERGRASTATLPTTGAEDSAAIIFTSGSTGPPKGVLYTHRMFETQAAEIRRMYDLAPGGVDLACFALFGLFNSAMGVTTVFPEMDFSRPASADPHKLLSAAHDWGATQAFASPAVWDKLSGHCEQTGERIPTLRKVFSCGAPVSAEILKRTLACVAKGAEMHTPYGATEALPVATIEAREVLGETAAATSKGAGVCVGRKFESIEWRVIQITSQPIAHIDDAAPLPTGETGELIVRGPQVSPAYVVAINAKSLRDLQAALGVEAANSISKIADGATMWHRMGDVGYLDAKGRFWYCGRKSQQVDTKDGLLSSVPVESVFDTLPGVRRSALVGVGPPGMQKPVLVVELHSSHSNLTAAERDRLVASWFDKEPRLSELLHAPYGVVPSGGVLFHPSLPVDVRHNAKIDREELAVWATRELTRAGGGDAPAR